MFHIVLFEVSVLQNSLVTVISDDAKIITPPDLSIAIACDFGGVLETNIWKLISKLVILELRQSAVIHC